MFFSCEELQGVPFPSAPALVRGAAVGALGAGRFLKLKAPVRGEMKNRDFEFQRAEAWKSFDYIVRPLQQFDVIM